MSEASTPRSVELAKRLKAAGAKMYGAFWCSHCFEQKQSFGKDAVADLPYVECYPDGYYKVSNPHVDGLECPLQFISLHACICGISLAGA